MTSKNGNVTLRTRVVASSKQISCGLSDEAVILNLEEGVYYGLNAVASRIWGLVQQPRTISEIRDTLLSEFEIEESRCTQDLIDLLHQLERWGLVDLEASNGSPDR